jgi:hypothetical protein
MFPATNLPTFCGHPNDNSCSLNLEAANARRSLILSIQDVSCTCLSCRKTIAAPRDMAAMMFVQGRGMVWHRCGGHGAVCEKCGATNVALEKGMRCLADSWKSVFAVRFAEATGQTQRADADAFVHNHSDSGAGAR